MPKQHFKVQHNGISWLFFPLFSPVLFFSWSEACIIRVKLSSVARLTAVHLFLPAAVAMEDVTRLVSSGDCLKIWDSTSMTVVEQFNPHSATHPVAQVCWSSSSILYHCEITHFWASLTCPTMMPVCIRHDHVCSIC